VQPPLLHYEVHEGSGPHLVLVHGLLASRAQWRLNTDELARVCRPVVVELFAHGRSPAPEDPMLYAPAHYVVELERIRAALGAERWLVCGQSLGAALTLRYALDHPERVIAQVFTNSNSALAEPGWAELVRPAMERQARLLIEQGSRALDAMPVHPRHARRMPAEVKDALVADCALHDPRGIGLSCIHTVAGSSVRERIGENRVPALLVVGERETRFEPQRRFAEARMPLLEVVGLDAGHAVNAEAAKDWNAEVVGFLERSGR
jgi:pimeloyl-ACP methyl ester carboxylesterase